jgi:hypothetical protein
MRVVVSGLSHAGVHASPRWLPGPGRAARRAAGVQLGFGQQGAQDLPVVLAQGNGPAGAGGRALQLAEVIEA